MKESIESKKSPRGKLREMEESGRGRGRADRDSQQTANNRTRKGQKPNDWHEIDWRKAERKIKEIQEEIVIATRSGKWTKVYRIQWVLLRTIEARALAVRRVVTNKGGKTPGTDGIAWKGSKDYWNAMKDLEKIVERPEEYRAQPLRRVYIPKGNNTGEMRPLGIPTLTDRTVQAIYHLAVDPVVETQSDPNSYGFRKCRSTHDAMIALRSHMDKATHPRWILEADIRKCFDRIDHNFLLERTPIIHKCILEEWLKSGIMEEMNYVETKEGTPQGGIISPTLCNIALNGLESEIRKANPLKKGISAGVHLIRYADDMVITGKNQTILLRNKQIISSFLKERGLELNEEKTKLTHIKNGFDFLGFNIKRMLHNPRLNKKTDQPTVLVIRPSKKGIDKLTEKIKGIIAPNKPMAKIISELNPVLRGWAEHKRISYHSQATFIKLDHWMFKKMMKWVHSRGGSKRRVLNRYLISTETRRWNWGLSRKLKILNLGEVPIVSPRPLKLNRNPYMLEHSEYFNKRKENLIYAKFRAAIYRKFKHLCAKCGESLYNGETVELHHIVPQKTGGKYSMKNIEPLHQICHQQETHRPKPNPDGRTSKT